MTDTGQPTGWPFFVPFLYVLVSPVRVCPLVVQSIIQSFNHSTVSIILSFNQFALAARHCVLSTIPSFPSFHHSIVSIILSKRLTDEMELLNPFTQ